VIDRCNLTILLAPGSDHFLRDFTRLAPFASSVPSYPLESATGKILRAGLKRARRLHRKSRTKG
jgi:hypothetical protein